MYPPVYDQPARYSTDSRFSAESRPGSTAVSGLPKPATPQPHPPYMVSAAGMPSPCLAQRWSTGLCHCCDDPANCIITAFCPCITFGQIAEIVNKGSPSCVESGALYGLLLAVTGFACLYSCFYRSRLRSQYDLPEAPCTDCLVHFCCETCSLCQEYRELKARGYDMGIGNTFKDCFKSLDICSSSKP